MEITPEHLREALRLDPFDDEAARGLMAAHPRSRSPARPYRDGAVLAPFFPENGELRALLTRRSFTVEHHRGQISFPGGAREDGETMREAALREAEEEIGLAPGSVEILGELELFRIPPSGFIVRPFIALLSEPPDCRPDPGEVTEVLSVPLPLLLDPTSRRERDVDWNGRRLTMPYFDVPGWTDPPLWGATAMMLSGLVERVRAVLQST